MSTPPFDNPFRESRLNNALDFRPEWDVPSLNEKAVKALVQEVRRAQGKNRPNPEQLIPVILAAPGYGKTHMFGRVCHELGGEAFFVYVPGMEDLSRPLEHICRHVVEAFFRSPPGKPSLLAQALARLCHSSFREYLQRFPPSLAPRFQPLALALAEGPARIHEVVGAVKELPPFLKLADSIAERAPQGAHDTPKVPHEVMKALALGWSPPASLVRRWLKGESLPEQDLERLGLSGDSPAPLDVLQGISAILQYRLPVVICCDQFEIPIVGSTEAANKITAQLMGILEKVPNQVLVLSCLEAEWKTFIDKAFQSFLQRTSKNPLRLDYLKEDQAVDLVARRLDSSQERAKRSHRLWPFDESSLLTYLRDKGPTPRALIQACAGLFQEWLDGGRQGPIYFGKGDNGGTGAQQFLRMWNAELDKIRDDATFTVEEYPIERMQKAVREALCVARESLRDMGGVRVKNIKEDAIRQSPNAGKRYAFAVEVGTASGSGEVLMPVTDLNNGRKFIHYIRAVLDPLTPLRLGAILVHRLSQFETGEKGQELFDEAVAEGRLRLFALEDSPQTLERLECLVRFLDRAVSRELQLDGHTLSAKDCQAYILETAVLDSLDLFKLLGTWKQLQPAPTGPPSPPVEPPIPLAEPVAVTSQASSKAGEEATATAAAASAQPAPTLTVAPPAAGLDDFAEKFAGWANEKLTVLVKKLTTWGQPVQAHGVEVGPAFARLKVVPSGSKTTINRIRDRAEDVKIHLGLEAMPLIDSQASYVSVDVQLPERRIVTLNEALASQFDHGGSAPAFPAGADVSGKMHWLDLSDTADCHLLVAGQTGSGKSELLRAMVAALARRLPCEQLQVILIDPKRVTFNLGMLESPYLKFPVALDTKAALPLLQWCLEETRRRYDLLAEKKKTNVADLEDTTLIPRIVVVIDEFANLLEEKQSKSILTALLRQIGSMSRAAGIHLVLATQRPDKDVVTPLLRDNLPGRVALQVKTEASSKLIIGATSAAYLLGKGDLLWQHAGGLLRLQSPFVTQEELERALKAH